MSRLVIAPYSRARRAALDHDDGTMAREPARGLGRVTAAGRSEGERDGFLLVGQEVVDDRKERAAIEVPVPRRVVVRVEAGDRSVFARPPEQRGQRGQESRLQERGRDVKMRGPREEVVIDVLGPEGRQRAGRSEHGAVTIGAHEDHCHRRGEVGVAGDARNVDPGVGKHCEHKIARPVSADQADEGRAQAQPRRGVGHERATPAEGQRRALDLTLGLAECELLGRAPQDHVGVRVAEHDEVVAIGH